MTGDKTGQNESTKVCPCVLQMEQVSDDELDHAAEEDSDKEDQDLDKMFGAWLGELDKLTQVTRCPSCCLENGRNVVFTSICLFSLEFG